MKTEQAVTLYILDFFHIRAEGRNIFRLFLDLCALRIGVC